MLSSIGRLRRAVDSLERTDEPLDRRLRESRSSRSESPLLCRDEFRGRPSFDASDVRSLRHSNYVHIATMSRTSSASSNVALHEERRSCMVALSFEIAAYVERVEGDTDVRVLARRL